MKKLVIVGLLMILAIPVFAKNKRADYTYVNVKSSTAISNTAWTAIPVDAEVDSKRIALWIDLADGTTNHVLLMFSNSESSPTESTAFGMKMKESDPPWILPISQNVRLYGIASGAGTESLIFQQLRGEY